MELLLASTVGTLVLLVTELLNYTLERALNISARGTAHSAHVAGIYSSP
jgi:hypothetical protein